MIRILAAAGIGLAAGGVAWLLSRRQRATGVAGAFPSHIVFAEVGLAGPGVVVFVDPGCRSCEAAVAEVRRSGRPYVVVDDAALRRRYRVEGVPTVLDVAADGVVARGWVGPVPPGALRCGRTLE